MIPTISPILVQGTYVEPVARRTRPLESYARGGENLNDANAGLQGRTWKAEYVDGSVVLSSDGKPDTVLWSRPDITQISLTFDQAMRPYLAFTQDGDAWWYWYDTIGNTFVFTQLAADVQFPYCTTDEKRPILSADSDVILSYMRGDTLYCRVQRERFETEHLLEAGIAGELTGFGMNNKNRLQWRFKPT